MIGRWVAASALALIGVACGPSVRERPPEAGRARSAPRPADPIGFRIAADLDLSGGLAVSPDGDLLVGGTAFGPVTIGAVTTDFDGFDGWVARLSARGELRWILPLRGEESQYVDALALDPSGVVTLTGAFDHDLRVGDRTLEAPAREAFVASLDGRDGRVRWLRSWPSAPADLAPGPDGHVLLAAADHVALLDRDDGHERWRRALPPSQEVHARLGREGICVAQIVVADEVTIGDRALPEVGLKDLIVTWLDAGGEVLDATRFGGPDGAEISLGELYDGGVTVDAEGRCVMAGRHAGSVTIGDVPFPAPAEGYAPFVARFDGPGVAPWGRSLFGDSPGDFALARIVDAGGWVALAMSTPDPDVDGYPGYALVWLDEEGRPRARRALGTREDFDPPQLAAGLHGEVVHAAAQIAPERAIVVERWPSP